MFYNFPGFLDISSFIYLAALYYLYGTGGLFLGTGGLFLGTCGPFLGTGGLFHGTSGLFLGTGGTVCQLKNQL